MRRYNGCRLTRERLESPRYFGNPDYPRNPVQYRALCWRVDFPDGTWTLCGTLRECREYVDRAMHRHAAKGTAT